MSERSFKDVMSLIPTSVSIIGLRETVAIRACTISSLVSLDISAPKIMFVLQNSSSTLDSLRDSKEFSVSVLNETQLDISKKYSSFRESEYGNEESSDWEFAEQSIPFIKSSYIVFFCNHVEILPFASTSIVIASVFKTISTNDQTPLTYHQRKYSKITHLDLEPH